MSRVITFSRVFPSYHPRKGEPTYFVEKVWESLYPEIVGWEGFFKLNEQFNIGLNNIYEPKHHTIRAGNRFKEGDYFSPRVWSGKPYRSKQIVIAPDIKIKKTWDILIDDVPLFQVMKPINGDITHSYLLPNGDVACNDGLAYIDFVNWFNKRPFRGQIICWNENINY